MRIRQSIMFYSSIIPRPLNNFLHCFTLKQGTVLIAIVQLFAAGIAVTFCILALTHAVDIREMVARDAEDAMDRGVFEDDNSMRLNMKRMKIAGCNAKGKVDEMWYHLIFGLTHLAFIILLLYGVLTNHRIFMTPWIYLNLIEFSMIFVLLVRNKPIMNLSRCMSEFMLGSAAIINFYSLYVVWSTYASLNRKKGLIHEIHDVKKKQIQSTSECTKSSSRLATKPYEV